MHRNQRISQRQDRDQRQLDDRRRVPRWIRVPRAQSDEGDRRDGKHHRHQCDPRRHADPRTAPGRCPLRVYVRRGRPQPGDESAQRAAESASEVDAFALLQLDRNFRSTDAGENDSLALAQRPLPFVADVGRLDAVGRSDEHDGVCLVERSLESPLPILAGLEIPDVQPDGHALSQQVKGQRFREVVVLARIAQEQRRFRGHRQGFLAKRFIRRTPGRNRFRFLKYR